MIQEENTYEKEGTGIIAWYLHDNDDSLRQCFITDIGRGVRIHGR